MKFTLDQMKAKEADNLGGRITATGKYVGVIKSFEFGNFESGSQYVEIGFESHDKQSASMRIITMKKDGTESSYGVNKIHALMTCLKIRESSMQKETRRKYDFTQRAEIDKVVYFAPEFEGKEVGLLIEMEGYENRNGEYKEKPALFASFEPQGEFTAKEILDKATKPEKLAELVATMQNRKPKTPKPQQQSYQSQGYENQSNADDDLPW